MSAAALAWRSGNRAAKMSGIGCSSKTTVSPLVDLSHEQLCPGTAALDALMARYRRRADVAYSMARLS